MNLKVLENQKVRKGLHVSTESLFGIRIETSLLWEINKGLHHKALGKENPCIVRADYKKANSNNVSMSECFMR